MIASSRSRPRILISATSGEDTNKAYLETILAHGGIPILVQSKKEFLASKPHGILLPGGGDLSHSFYDHSLTKKELQTLGKIEPAREKLEFEILNWAFKNNIPTLGICRGCQILNAFSHGTLIPDIPTWQKKTRPKEKIDHRNNQDPTRPIHSIHINPKTKFFSLFKKNKLLSVNSSHHQALSRCGNNLVVSAQSSDGIIEAIEHPKKKFWIGVQFHPERMWKKFPLFSNLFATFIKAAKK